MFLMNRFLKLGEEERTEKRQDGSPPTTCGDDSKDARSTKKTVERTRLKTEV